MSSSRYRSDKKDNQRIKKHPAEAVPANNRHSLGSTLIVSHCPPSSKVAAGNSSVIFAFNSSLVILSLSIKSGAIYLRLIVVLEPVSVLLSAHFLFFPVSLSMHATVLRALADSRQHIHLPVSHGRPLLQLNRYYKKRAPTDGTGTHGNYILGVSHLVV